MNSLKLDTYNMFAQPEIQRNYCFLWCVFLNDQEQGNYFSKRKSWNSLLIFFFWRQRNGFTYSVHFKLLMGLHGFLSKVFY